MFSFNKTIYRKLRKWYNEDGDNMTLNYKLGSIVMMKKQHPCGTNEWEITRVGADIKIKCINCNRTIMLPRLEFNKKIKKVIKEWKKKEKELKFIQP